MPIPAATVVNRMAAALDAEGSDRYTFAQDYKFAINNAVEWSVSVLNQAFAEKKMSPESLRELVKVSVWQANKYSRVSYNEADTGHALWTILSVIPEIQVTPQKVVVPLANENQSIFRNDFTYIGSEKYCTRLTTEEWNVNRKNIFMPGNEIMQGALKEYAYRDFADYSSANYTNPVNAEIEIRPSVSQKLVAIEYLKYPTPVAVIGDSIEMPASMTDIITEKALNYIAWKQGDNTTLWSTSERDINLLISLMR